MPRSRSLPSRVAPWRLGRTTIAALALALAALPVRADLVAETPHILVTGTGEVDAVPDMATLTLGVDLQAQTAAEASGEAAERMADILEVLEDAGVAPEDIQTTGLSLRPVYEPRRTDLERAPRLLGFAAENTLTVTVRALDGLGTLLDEVIDEGANSFRGVQFGLQDATLAEEDARRDAVADALATATLMAEAAGAERGPILTMREEGGGIPRPQMAARVASEAAVPVAPGSLTVRAQVTVIFELLQ